MDETGRDAWFFSRDGQQSGPLRFEEIREKAREGVLRPRTDLLWKEGMPDWKPIGEIEGIFERKPVEMEPEMNPYVAPRENEAATVAMYGEWPGTRRRIYLVVAVALPFLVSFAFGLATRFLGDTVAPEQVARYSLILNGVIFVLMLWVTLQRLANVGMSRWWFLGNFVPVLNLWVGYRTFACPAGYAAHKKMDRPGIFLAIVYWLLVIVALFLVAAILFELREMMENLRIGR